MTPPLEEVVGGRWQRPPLWNGKKVKAREDLTEGNVDFFHRAWLGALWKVFSGSATSEILAREVRATYAQERIGAMG